MRVLINVIIYVCRTVKSLHVRNFQIEGHDIPSALLRGGQVDLGFVLLTLYSRMVQKFFLLTELLVWIRIVLASSASSHNLVPHSAVAFPPPHPFHPPLPTMHIKLIFIFVGGPGSVVGIVTGYRLDSPGIESQWGRGFPHLSRPALCPPSLLYNGYWVFPWGKEWPGRDADP